MAALPLEPEPPFVAWAIVNFALLFFFGSLFSLPGGLLALMARSKWSAGLREEARKQLRLAQILTFAGIGLGVLAFVGFIVFVVILGSVG